MHYLPLALATYRLIPMPIPAKPLIKTALLVLQGGLVCTAFRLPEDKKAV
ncbi:hypothetical protein [Neisseria elongata]